MGCRGHRQAAALHVYKQTTVACLCNPLALLHTCMEGLDTVTMRYALASRFLHKDYTPIHT